MTLLLALTALAGAALPTLEGASGATSVALLASIPGGETAALCADDGAAPDAIAGDGIWACGALGLGPGDRVGVVLDGGALIGPIELERSYDAPHLMIREGALEIEDRIPASGVAGAPRPATPALIVEVDRGPVTQAYMLEVEGSSRQISCNDHGAFPDLKKNDDVPVCAGPAPGRTLRLRLRTPSAELEEEYTWPESAALLMSRWDSAGLQPIQRPLMPEMERRFGAGETDGVGRPPEDALPASGAAPGGPSGGAMGPGQGGGGLGGRGLLGLLGLVFAGGAAWRLSRGEPGPPHLSPVPPPGPRLREVQSADLAADLAAQVTELAARGPVIVVGAELPLPFAAPGPVLRATSRDVLDVLDAIDGLIRRDPLSTPSVLIVGAAGLENPAGLGVPPIERLLGDAPERVQVTWLHPDEGAV